MFMFNRGIDLRFVDRLNAEYERGGLVARHRV
jgi:hypothetical protein